MGEGATGGGGVSPCLGSISPFRSLHLPHPCFGPFLFFEKTSFPKEGSPVLLRFQVCFSGAELLKTEGRRGVFGCKPQAVRGVARKTQGAKSIASAQPCLLPVDLKPAVLREFFSLSQNSACREKGEGGGKVGNSFSFNSCFLLPFTHQQGFDRGCGRRRSACSFQNGDLTPAMPDLYTVVLGLLVLLPLLGNIFFPYLWLDLVFLFRTIRSGYRCYRYIKRSPAFALLDVFLARAQECPEKPLVLFREETYTYREIDQRSSQVARVLRNRVGLKEGDTAAVFLENVPAYIWVWMGLEKVGCTMACVNYNIRSKSLLHVLRSCEAKVLLTTPDFQAAIEEVLPTLKNDGIRVFYLSDDSPTEGVEALLGHIKCSSPEPVPVSWRSNLTPKSPCLYIFTSGTTGLPKAAIITRRKLLLVSAMYRLCGVCPKDIIYVPLPMYHSAALLIAIGGCLEVGATFVLRSKFSASHFWDDCRRYRVTVIQYVGEMMRYLCNSPKKDNDRDHSVRIAIGNGMRMEVWKEFLRRFGFLQIYEFYGATEGNVGFINYTGKVGAVGKTNYLHKKLTMFQLIKYDVDQDEAVRDEKGHCIPVAAGETGLLVAKITEVTPFVGYAGDRQKTESKILRDVIKKGDCYFNTGDLLMEDHEGFMYFQDRVGDTFRWKGENVATREVESILSTVDFIQEVNVYGVPVPGHEGKIGMAAVQLKEEHAFDGKTLYEHVKASMPNYAVPRFIRLRDTLEITGTFKQCKGQLVREGFNPAVIGDPLYFLDDAEKCYVPMTEQIWDSITEKKMKL